MAAVEALYTRSDKEILRAVISNPDDGFRLLLKQYKESVYWHIRRITVTHSDAEDALQETFMRVFRNLDKLNEEMSLTAWVFRIATNEAIRQRERYGKSAISLDDDDVSEAHAIAADDYIDYSDLEAVKLQKAIRSLPPKQQIAFNLRYYDEFDYATIAQITESTVNNVKANYHAAKEKIIRFMNSND
ncbi:MAG: RNA polymerase sigma factor [Muribaculaceae bacterium]|nr:RNA polymerase sigma factor [Muribaculaceae bacterium]